MGPSVFESSVGMRKTVLLGVSLALLGGLAG